jgi:hypothetical protein
LEPKCGGGNIAAAKLMIPVIAKVNLLTSGFIMIISPILTASLGATALAELADQRTGEFTTALQHDDFAEAERACSAPMRAGMPQIKVILGQHKDGRVSHRGMTTLCHNQDWAICLG